MFECDFSLGLDFDKSFYFTNILLGTNPGHVLNVINHALKHRPEYVSSLQSAAIQSLLSNRSLYLSPQEMQKKHGKNF